MLLILASGSYDFSSTSNIFKSLIVDPIYPSLTAHIWFLVNVPVLSEQITVVQPKVSTDGNLLTIAFYAAIFLVPNAKQVVITAGRPSGIAATAKAIAILK